MWAFLMVAGLAKPPQRFDDIKMKQMSFSNIGPIIVWEEDGNVRWADEFNFWKFLFRMLIMKSAGTFSYIYGAPFIGMLLVWEFSMNTLIAACIFWGVVALNFGMTIPCLIFMYKYSLKKIKQRAEARSTEI